jgi:hypothetical protein
MVRVGPSPLTNTVKSELKKSRLDTFTFKSISNVFELHEISVTAKNFSNNFKMKKYYPFYHFYHFHHFFTTSFFTETWFLQFGIVKS